MPFNCIRDRWSAIKIISNYHDYYDSTMGLGFDTERLWIRTQDCLTLRFPLKFREGYLFGTSNDSNSVPSFFLSHYNDTTGPYIGSYLILLAGKLYPGVEVRASYLDSSQHFYTLDSFIRYVAKNNMSDLLQGYKKRVEKDMIRNIKDLFDLQGSEMLRDFAIEHRITIATDWSHNLNFGSHARTLTVNPMLSRLQFQKCLDPVTVYQELEMWVGGVLTEPEAPNPVPDLQRVINHGFDSKLSFRKGKEVK